MKLTGIARDHFNEWRFEVKKHLRDYVKHNDLIMYTLIEEWFNTKGYYFIPSPITGSKNGYDSFPIIGWRTDILIPARNNVNSYYMGYPVLDWFIMDDLEEGETIEDHNVDKSNTIKESKIKAYKDANEIYNGIHKRLNTPK